MRRILLILVFSMAVTVSAAQVAQPSENPAALKSLRERLHSFLGENTSVTIRGISRHSLLLIKTFEGWSASKYDDPAGYCTIGFGHLIALARCDVAAADKFTEKLTAEEGEALLEKDSVSARAAVADLVKVALNEDQFGALASFVFNVGRTNFSRSSLLRFLNDQQYELVTPEFSRWVKAGGKVYSGLISRRNCEAMHFQGVLPVKAGNRLDPRDCRSFGAAPGIGDLIDIELGE